MPVTNIVVGAGYAGAITARLLAEKKGERVLLLEKRSHIAGNMYDERDSAGVLTHIYGPHIAVMHSEEAFNFLSRFTDWLPYEHRVNAEIDGKEVPLPFNFTAILELFGETQAQCLIQKLIKAYGPNQNVPILKLRQSDDSEIRELAEFVYEKVFVHYTGKMWGKGPEEIDPAVTARVPIRLSFDNRHFQHTFQVMPRDGYTKLFENMLDHPLIDVQLNCDAVKRLTIVNESSSTLFDGESFTGRVIYTGALDRLLGYRFGALPYRSLKFAFETWQRDTVQTPTVLNWPDTRPATRRTEMKKLTGQHLPGVSTTITEYPGEYSAESADFSEPYYPIPEPASEALHNRYAKVLAGVENFYALGRLADYRYYNMEDTVLRALQYYKDHFAD